jgi:hypothetical protein
MHRLAVILLALILLGLFVVVLALLYVSLTIFVDTIRNNNQNHNSNGTL